MRVFVVEGDPDLRAFLEAFIGARHTVRAFGDAHAALGALRESPPDVLLCDLGPRSAGGEGLAREASALPIAPRVVLMSADHRRLESCRPLAQASLPKPFAMKSLTAALEGLPRLQGQGPDEA